ncbi:uncharacterized protein LOC114790560 isoform X2 [Denticeps clupeoides]|uniref:uncharacterized protein LOC114790560 isoform X2 n=1 Tax=Denticeps clupeoides TaxID=299321 RepID=UPI0010A47CC4|nr:uncharacterized protein LOC114790560 isoform X2 [Denticeps clupeoides]
MCLSRSFLYKKAKMDEKEWFSSKLALCELIFRPNSSSYTEVLFDSQSCPAPKYTEASVLSSLESYKHAIANHRTHNSMTDDKIPRQQSQVHQTSVHRFAQALSENVLQNVAVEVRRESPTSCSVGVSVTGTQVLNQSHRFSEKEDLAELLASMVLQKAFEEVLRNEHIRERSYAHSPVQSTGQNRKGLVFHNDDIMDWENSSVRHQEHARVYDSATSLSSLTQAGLPSNRSLDYPDAPPSTPLLPEMMKSRASFCRKLKGGLAKEFLPSPPPPTPKENSTHSPLEVSGATAEEKAEFIDRLMRSLSLEYSECKKLGAQEENEIADHKGRPQNEGQETWATISNYAEGLSADVIRWVTTSHLSQTHPKTKKDGLVPGLLLIAEPLACQILEDSFAEIQALKTTGQNRVAQSTSKPNSLKSEEKTRLSRDFVEVRATAKTPKVQSQLKIVCLGDFAEQLITNSLVETFAEIERDALHPGPGPLRPDPALGTREKPVDQTLCSHKNIRPMNGIFSNGEAVKNTGTLQQKVLNSALDCYAEDIIADVTDCSIKHTLKHLLSRDKKGDNSLIPAGEMKQNLHKLLLVKTCSTVTELQGLLLWAATSQQQASMLQLLLPDARLQVQFCSVASRAHLTGWTVGDLVTSVCQYCAQLAQDASRGSQASGISLLGFLQEQTGVEH